MFPLLETPCTYLLDHAYLHVSHVHKCTPGISIRWRSFVSPLVVGQSPSSGQRVKRSFSFSINFLPPFAPSFSRSPPSATERGLFALFTLFFRFAAPSPYRRPLSFPGSLGSLPRSARSTPHGISPPRRPNLRLLLYRGLIDNILTLVEWTVQLWRRSHPPPPPSFFFFFSSTPISCFPASFSLFLRRFARCFDDRRFDIVLVFHTVVKLLAISPRCFCSFTFFLLGKKKERINDFFESLYLSL